MRIVWSRTAERDLFTIIGYINERSPQNAKKVLTKIKDFANTLNDFVYKYPKEPIYNKENVRYAVIYSYKVVYSIHTDKIKILRIFHTKQHPSKI